MKYQCEPCGYIYDPAEGDPDSGIAPGTPFEDLPDDWTCPSGLTFVNSDSSYTSNVYNAANWALMEAAGAVFLPAAGQRTSSNTTNVGTVGNYWTTSHVNGTTGYTFHIAPNANAMRNNVTYSTGCSVRLVREY